MRLKIVLILLTLVSMQFAQNIDTEKWTYIEVDSSRQKWGDFAEPEWLRYFGISFQDVNHDALNDIVSGRYVYLNPGGEMLGPWKRIDLGLNVDAMISMNVDDDEYADIIAEALPNVYWLEADNKEGTSWKAKIIATLPKTGHNNGQGYGSADIFKGDKNEALITAEGGVYALIIPKKITQAMWEVKHVVKSKSDEGFDCADIDGDGDLDVIAGDSKTDGEHATILSWYENPGEISEDWKAHEIGETVNAIDRVRAADLNGDGLVDVAVAEEQFPPKGPTAYLFWFEQTKEGWKRNTVIEQWSLHNLDIADMDNDGDMDLITSEHQGKEPKTQIFENDGNGNFTERMIDQGKESHLGTRVCDLDNDGDLDIASIAWNNYKYVHVWRNDAVKFTASIPSWKTVSNVHFDFPVSKTGQQVAALTFDIDKDNINDFVIVSYTGMEWYKKKDEGNTWSTNPEISWDRYVIDHGYDVHLEAGGDYYDIDQDGDLDIVMGGSGQSNKVWWWENPYPNFENGKPWNRYLIKDEGSTQQHDQIIDDFDGDGKGEIFFWNQYSRVLYRTIIPEEPKKFENWKLEKTMIFKDGKNYEGMAKADINEDGLIDLVGGGLWFKYKGGKEFEPNLIDDYSVSRSAVGDFIEGGRVEVLIGSGDMIGPLNLYEWKNGTWNKTTLIDVLDHGHTLQVADFNNDGHLDIYTAEMHSPGAGSRVRQIILYGNGKGNFKKTLLSVGSGTHEGKAADLDGDGDIDILQKDFNFQRRIDVWLNNGYNVKPGEVRINSTFYRGKHHYKVTTKSAVFYLEKTSGGLTSMIDKSGNDWIDYSTTYNGRFPQSAAADFRGIPNMIYSQKLDNGTGHPGFNTIKKTEQIDKNKIRFESENGFTFSWSFYDDYAKLDIEKTIPDQTYWILYEGPVGGEFKPHTSYWGTNLGMRSDIPEYLSERIEEGWNWAYFGDTNQNRVIFIKQGNPDDLPDMLGYLGASEKGLDASDGMVVFGLGRNADTKSFFTEPNTFYFGFYENKIGDQKNYENLKDFLDNLK